MRVHSYFVLMLLSASALAWHAESSIACCAKKAWLSARSHVAAPHPAEKPTVYYRPFCRRSRYVTNPSAPCWG
jgi:hypothetical protein